MEKRYEKNNGKNGQKSRFLAAFSVISPVFGTVK